MNAIFDMNQGSFSMDMIDEEIKNLDDHTLDLQE